MTLSAKTETNVPGSATATGRAQTVRGQGNLDPRVSAGGGRDVVRTAVATYDFARDGSPTAAAAGAGGMGLGVFIPSDSIIVRAYAISHTAVALATADPTTDEIYLSVENDADLLDGDDLDDSHFEDGSDAFVLFYDPTDSQTLAPGAAVTVIKTTADREIKFGADAAVTAGKFTLVVEYVTVPDVDA